MSPGPQPKKQRVRAQKPAGGEVRSVDARGWRWGEIPPPPDGIHVDSVTAWYKFFQSWPAAYWLEDDLPGLELMIRLHSCVMEGDVVRNTELRRWLDDYGLTPQGQRNLRIEAPPEPEPTPSPSKPSAAKAGPYDHLRYPNGRRT